MTSTLSRRGFVVGVGGALAAACAAGGGTDRGAAAPSGGAGGGDGARSFDAFAADYLRRYLELTPTDATQIGEHRYDGRWPDLSAAGEERERHLLADVRRDLASFDPRSLPEQQRVDHATVANTVALWQFSLDELKDAERDPLHFTRIVGDGLDPLLTRDFAPLEVRQKSLAERLRGLPQVVAAAKARLREPPRLHTETAIEQNKGLVDLCSDPSVPRDAAAVARAALEDFQRFLEGELLARSTGELRLGRARFERKLALTLDDDVDCDAVVRSARELLDTTRKQMIETARAVWSELARAGGTASQAPPPAEADLVRVVLARLAEDRSTNATIVGDATAILDQATRFVREHDLVRVPDEPCRVIEMPEYRRGVAIAYCESTGPLEKKQETFFAISPTPKDWPAARAESFYREYNRSMLSDLTVHEAMPGHYLQAMHNNAFKSDVRAVFANGAFVEGWAVYGEWLMSEKGFGGPRVRLMREKMVLRLCANAILDHGVHAGTMTEQQAMELMVKDAFQEEGEAVAKWKRARLTSAQLTTYFHGLDQMTKLRRATKGSLSERAYHDKLLGFGSPSFRYLRALMSGAPAPGAAGTPSIARR